MFLKPFKKLAARVLSGLKHSCSFFKHYFKYMYIIYSTPIKISTCELQKHNHFQVNSAYFVHLWGRSCRSSCFLYSPESPADRVHQAPPVCRMLYHWRLLEFHQWTVEFSVKQTENEISATAVSSSSLSSSSLSSLSGSLSTDDREPRTATGSRMFSFLERFEAITFVTSSHRRPTRTFPIRFEEQKRANKGNIRLPVTVRGSRSSHHHQRHNQHH